MAAGNGQPAPHDYTLAVVAHPDAEGVEREEGGRLCGGQPGYGAADAMTSNGSVLRKVSLLSTRAPRPAHP